MKMEGMVQEVQLDITIELNGSSELKAFSKLIVSSFEFILLNQHLQILG